METINASATVSASIMEKLFDRFDHFPESSAQSTMLYNHIKLLGLLQQKEVAAICADETLVNQCFELSNAMGRLVSVMNSDSERGIEEYMHIERRMEATLPDKLYLFAKQWGLSVKALYYYKKNAYRQAYSLTLECIVFNEYLLREGMQTLLFRTAEQNRNLARVLFKMNEWHKAADLSACILEYLLNGTNKGLIGSVFDDKNHWDALPYVREGYTYEYFRGLVTVMVRENGNLHNKNRELFQVLFKDLEFEVNTPDRLIMYNWIYLKDLFYSGNFSQFVEDLMEFMQEDIGQAYDVLKISFFQDLSYLVQHSDCDNKKEFIFKIKHHLDHKLKIYDILRDNVSVQYINNFPFAFSN